MIYKRKKISDTDLNIAPCLSPILQAQIVKIGSHLLREYFKRSQNLELWLLFDKVVIAVAASDVSLANSSF
jgi:hypothetical protein